jgi:hypothetical protein
MWAPGDAVVVRYVEPWGPVSGLPVRVLEDSRERVALYLARGTELHWPAIGGRTIRDASLEERYTSTWGHLPQVWGDGSLLLVFPVGRAYGLWLFFDDAGTFRGEWYVNLQAPFRRTPIGLDTRDHTLDLWLAEDGSHRWKDENELDAAVRLGFFTAAEAAGFREEGERVAAELPVPTGFESFRPNDAWAYAALPEGWELVPSPLAASANGLEQSRHEGDDASRSHRR